MFKIYVLISFRKPRLGRPPKYLRLEVTPKEPEEEEVKKPKRRYRRRIKRTPEEEEPSSKISKIESLINEATIEPASKETWVKHSRFLEEYVDDVDDPLLWSVNKVAEFISTVPGSEDHSNQFRQYEIDGEAFLSLNQKDLIEILDVKVGPAVKLYNIIVLLRRKVCQMFT